MAWRRRVLQAGMAVLLLGLGVGTAQAKDSLTIGIAEFPASLHPSIDALLIKNYVLGFAIRTITTYDKDGALICLLCTQVPSIENGLARIEDLPGGGKGMAVTIKLKPDLAWGDGVPVTAKDLAFTWRVGRDRNTGFSNPNSWSRASRVDVVDDHTAVLHLDHVMVSYAQWDQILPEHIEGPVYERAHAAGEYINTTAFNHEPTNPGLWDGPYMVSVYQPGAQIVMVPNPHWSGVKPGFKQIVLRYIGDTAALQANLLSGDIDIDNSITLDQVLAMQKQHPGTFDYTFTPSLTYAHMDIQKDNPFLQDARVRRALLLAIDRRTMNAKLFDGRQLIATSFVSPKNPFFDPSVPVAEYDPAQARKLLAEAGWTPGPDGICRNAAGQRLSIELLGASGFRINDLEMAVMQSQWKQVGIEVTLRTEPSRILFGQTAKHRTFSGLFLYTWTSSVGESPRLTLGSDQIPTEASNFGGANFLAFSDPKFDADIAISEAELDDGKRHAAWSDMQRIYADQLPALPLFITVIPQAVPTWLKGFGPQFTGQTFTQQAENWHSQ